MNRITLFALQGSPEVWKFGSEGVAVSTTTTFMLNFQALGEAHGADDETAPEAGSGPLAKD